MLEHMYHKPLLKEEELLATLHEYRDMVAPYVGDVSLFLDKAIKEGKKILLERPAWYFKRIRNRRKFTPIG